MFQQFRTIAIVLIFFVSGMALATTVFFFNTNYQEFSDTIIILYNLHEKATIFRSQYLTEFRFEVLKYILIGVSLIIPLVGFYIYLYLEIIYFSLKQIYFFLRNLVIHLYETLDALSPFEKNLAIVAFTIISISRLYFSFAYPIHIDEAFSYVFLVDKGFFVTLFYYPGPNNHVLYLLLCGLADHLFSNPWVAMRLPVLLISTITTILIFTLVKYYSNFRIAFWGSLLFSLSEYGLFYAVHGRGYFLLLLILIFCILSLFKIVKGGFKYYYAIFIIASILGFFTIPVFIFPFASLITFGLIYSWKFGIKQKVRWISVATLIVILGTGVCYTPILIGSGWTVLFQNSWVASLSWEEFILKIPGYLAESASAFYSMDYLGVIFRLINLGFWAFVFYKPEFFSAKGWCSRESLKMLSLLMLCFYVIPFPILLVKKVLPFFRIWLYLGLLEYFGLVTAIFLITKKYKVESLQKTTWTLIPAIVYTLFFLTFLQLEILKPTPYRQYPKLVDYVLRKKANRVFVTEDLYNVFLRYEGLKYQKHLTIHVTNPFPGNRYDFIITKKKESFPTTVDQKSYEAFYEDDYVKAFEKKW
ncbi:hypothetical protein [Flexithrix dorotheae]|uniref:hypothetical protein n=1 Tax=Flexithrix dorotheae TaxID=70993 RepID=UPI00035E8951|nr:hypothetical protein [Flexithrix dorotheae]